MALKLQRTGERSNTPTCAGIFPRIRRHWLLGNSSLEISWRAIPQGGVQPPVVVIAKIPAEREPQHPLRLEARAVDDLGLQRMKERFHVGVVAGVPPRVALWRMPKARSRSRNAWPAYSLPRSLWKISPAPGCRRRTAASRTPRVRRASRVRPSLQASTRREHWSSTTARKRHRPPTGR